MLAMYQVLVIVHVATAMVWFGGTMFTPRRVRDALTAERSIARREMGAVARQARMTTLFAVLIFVTGLGLAFLAPGGFGGLAPRFHQALTLTVIWVLVEVLLTSRRTKSLAAAVDGEEPIEACVEQGKRLAMLTGIQLTLFSVVLVLMLWKL